MDERSMSLIRDSLEKLIPIAEQANALFNVRLLDTYPDLYRLFAMDIDARQPNFVRSLAIAVARLQRHGAILPATSDVVGERKVYRLVHDNYEAVGLTLMWTLRRCLGTKFTFEVERAWQKALAVRRNSVAASG